MALFRVNPDLEFSVVPFEFQRGDFREVGRKEGARWAFFTTCIGKFPLTAGLIDDAHLRKLYLKRWRQTQGFFLCKTLARQLAGLGGVHEHITWRILAPLLAWNNPKTCLLALILRGMALLPSVYWQLLIAWWSTTRSPEQLEALDLGWLVARPGAMERFRLVRKTVHNHTAGQFL
jgi:hypothetical protein